MLYHISAFFIGELALVTASQCHKKGPLPTKQGNKLMSGHLHGCFFYDYTLVMATRHIHGQWHLPLCCICHCVVLRTLCTLDLSIRFVMYKQKH